MLFISILMIAIGLLTHHAIRILTRQVLVHIAISEKDPDEYGRTHHMTILKGFIPVWWLYYMMQVSKDLYLDAVGADIMKKIYVKEHHVSKIYKILDWATSVHENDTAALMYLHECLIKSLKKICGGIPTLPVMEYHKGRALKSFEKYGNPEAGVDRFAEHMHITVYKPVFEERHVEMKRIDVFAGNVEGVPNGELTSKTALYTVSNEGVLKIQKSNLIQLVFPQ